MLLQSLLWQLIYNDGCRLTLQILKMSKIIIIGIDGLDPLLLSKWKSELPNFNSMYNDVSDILMQSTFPPDSICAWASIFTGENPSEHGLIESINYLSDKKIKEDTDRAVHFKGKTFWDIAGRNGKRVCVINPFMAYPAWEVNGIMVSGPVFEGGHISAYPESLLANYKFPPIGGIVDFPEEKELGEFYIRTKEVTEQLGDVSLKIYKDYSADLFFVTFLTLDRIKHFFWRFTDEDDIYFPGDNPHKNTIKDFYILFDSIIGKFREMFDDDTTLMVISDHGHRRRCSKCLNLNEILRQKGYLETSGKGASAALKKILEMAKVRTISSLTNLGLQDWIYRIAKLIPNRKALKKSTYLIDKNSSRVTLSNLCGTNPYGGLDINASTDEEYERLREELINELAGLNTTLGLPVVKWVGRREEIYSGKHKDRLPDVLFELDDEYGVGMDMFSPSITRNYTHRKISGGHKREAVLLVATGNNRVSDIKRPHSLIELKDYILEIIDRKLT